MKRKKGVSPVIATILLILLSITVVIVISAFIIPFVRDTLREGKECFEVIGQLEIDMALGETCYHDMITYTIVNITIERGPKEATIERFKIKISGEGKSELFDIKQGETGVRMLDGSAIIETPKSGEARTYSLNTTLQEVLYAEVYPVMESGKMCDPTDKKDIEECRVL